MLKKVITLSCLVLMSVPVAAEEVTINATPARQFSGLTNSAQPKYPSLYRPKSVVDMQYDEMDEDGNQRDVVSVKKVIKEGMNTGKVAPMTYGAFPQNYDSSNSMMMMQGGMQGMFNQMGY